jgi:predicted transposase YbfD/YdcC
LLQHKKEWFSKTLNLEYAIPSHDTFNDVFSVLDIQLFSECFSLWMADIASMGLGEVISIDGKCLRRSMDKASEKSAIYMVSAWASKSTRVWSTKG